MLELFKFDSCPYCQKVLREIKSQGRTDVILRDTKESLDNRDRLIEVGGKEQVPCLFIDGKPMYESDDIVAWLKENPQN